VSWRAAAKGDDGQYSDVDQVLDKVNDGIHAHVDGSGQGDDPQDVGRSKDEWLLGAPPWQEKTPSPPASAAMVSLVYTPLPEFAKTHVTLGGLASAVRWQICSYFQHRTNLTTWLANTRRNRKGRGGFGFNSNGFRVKSTKIDEGGGDHRSIHVSSPR
jgi:hypothetical protein